MKSGFSPLLPAPVVQVGSATAMLELGRQAAAAVVPGMVIGLSGDLGAGKTHWTQGLVAGLGCEQEVSSPTFGLVHEYHGGRIPVSHADFYRLESSDELLALGWDEIIDAPALVIVEWADKFSELMPPGTCWLRFEVTGEQGRIVRAVESVSDA